MRFLLPVIKVGLVVIASIFVTTVTIDATDSFRSSKNIIDTVISGLAKENCPDGMVVTMLDARTKVCVDQFEAQVGDKCPFKEPRAIHETAENSMFDGCVPVSKSGGLPWRFVTQSQAKQLCALAGKQLIDISVWYSAALGTPENNLCVTDGSLERAGSAEKCLSRDGAYDMIGNVWEFVDGSVHDLSLENAVLPTEGFVESVDSRGIAVKSSSSPSVAMGDDYFWSQEGGDYAIVRGGFYGSRTDAGLYATHAAIAFDFGGGAIGFRCMKLLP